MTHAASRLLDVILASLAPAFLAFTGGDTTLAREAALEAIDEYRAKGCTDLITIGQIISHGFAAIASATQSLDAQLTPSETLQHRRAAVSLARSAERNRRAMRVDPPAPPKPAPEPAPEPETEAEPADLDGFAEAEIDAFLASESMARLRQPANPAPSRRGQEEMWAIAMVKEAEELVANAAHLPEKDRTLVRIQAGALTSAANSILTGQPLAPPDSASKPKDA